MVRRRHEHAESTIRSTTSSVSCSRARRCAAFCEAIAARAAVEIYDPARPISYTRTTYLDTNDLVYFSSAGGAPARRLRVREYAVAASAEDDPVLSGVAFIELKQHEGAARSKMRLSATPAEIARLIARHDVHQPSRRGHGALVGHRARAVAPHHGAAACRPGTGGSA